MYTKSRTLQKVAIEDMAPLVAEAIGEAGIDLADIDYMIPHQTSARAIRAGTQEFVRRLGAKPKHVVVNLEEFGNTSSTTLFVALHKYLEEQRIHKATGSCCWRSPPASRSASPYSLSTARLIAMGTRIEAVSALTSHGLRKPTARRLADAAARTCFAHAGREPGDVDMLINAGIYRDNSMGEPALAALIQEVIGANLGQPPIGGHGTFSFDLLNGICGVITAIQIESGLLNSGVIRLGAIVTSDVDPDHHHPGAIPLQPTAGAVLLGRD